MLPRPTSPTADFLGRAIDAAGLTHVEIAERAGFGAPNVISMMRTGRMKVPLDRIPDLAAACGVSERQFLRVAMAEYHPEVWDVLRASFGDVLTQTEQDLLAVYRLFDADGDIVIDEHLCDALSGVFGLALHQAPVSHPLGPTGRHRPDEEEV